jgi:hypothetical protein
MKFSIFNFQFSKKGVSLYLALVIMFILIAIALGVSLIIVSQMKMMKGVGDSVVAFYAADTGIEQTLYQVRVGGGWSGDISGSVGGASYYVTSPASDTYRSKGGFANVKRAIEIYSPPPTPPPLTWTESCNSPTLSGHCISISCSEGGEGICSNNFICTAPSPWCPDRANASSTNNCALDKKPFCFCNSKTFLCVKSGSCTTTGQCSYTCNPGWYNCDGNNFNGCESSVFPCP